MLKKTMATILSMVMLLSATGAFAASTTDSAGITTWEDNFDQHNVTEVTTVADGYPSATYTSDALAGDATNYTKLVTALVPGAGRNGSTALRVRAYSSYNSAQQAVKVTQTVGTDDIMELSYWIKVGEGINSSYPHDEAVYLGGSVSSSGAEQGAPFQIRKDGNFYARNESYAGSGSWAYLDTGVKYDYSKWYQVVVRHGSYTDGTTYYRWRREALLLDEQGNILASSLLPAWTWNTANNNMRYLAFFKSYSKATDEMHVLIDDVKVRYYKQNEVTGTVTEISPAISGATDVDVNTKKVTVTLNTAIDPAKSNATLTPVGGTAMNCTVTEISDKKYEISWANALLGETDYTLDLAGLSYNSGAKRFTTKYTFKTVAAAADVNSSEPSNGATGVSADAKSMTVTFNKAMTTVPGSVTLTGGSVAITAEVSSTDNKTFTFTWEDMLEGTTTYSVNLASFKDATGAAPVTTSVSFTTESAEVVKLIDSFESSTVLYKNAGYNTDSNSNPDATKSPLTLRPATIDTTVDPVSLVDGYTPGTKALRLQTGSDTNKTYLQYLRTSESHRVGENENLVATWRVRLDGAEENLYIGIGATTTTNGLAHDTTFTRLTMHDGKPVIYYSGDDLVTAREISIGKWYNITYVLSDSDESIYFTDAVTGEMVYQKTKASTRFANNAAAYMNIFQGKHADYDGGLKNTNIDVCIDDFTLWKVRSDRPEHKLALVGDVTGSNGTYTMSFNQPVIGTEDMLQAVEVIGSAPAEYNYDIDFAADFKYPDFCTMTVTLSELPYKSECLLDYSGLKAASGKGFKEGVTCLTGAFETGLDTVGTLTLAGTAKCDGSQISFKLYNDGGATEAPEVFVALYKEKVLLGVVIPTQQVSVASKGEVTVNVNAANYTEFDSVKVFAWDSDLKPLMSMYNRNISVSE